MKKTVLSILAAALCVSSMFAEEKKPEIKVSGFLRAGAAAKFADGENTFDTSKWYPGIYFSGDSTGTRFRLNLDAKTKLENGNTVQAFGRFEFDDKLAKNIDDGQAWKETIKYANVNVGLLVFDKYDKDDEAFTLKVVPAVRYNVTELLGLSLEVEYCQTFSDADLTPYVAFIPNVSFNVTTNISASLWGVISTDAAQKANMVGIGTIVNF